MGGKTKTNASTDASIAGINIQTSVVGGVRSLNWGRTKIAGNLIAYYDFRAVPHTSTTASGGKGGSSSGPSSTSFTYQAAVLMGLGDSLARGIVRAWKDKLVYGAVDVSSGTNLVSDDTVTADATTGDYTVALASVYVANVAVLWVGTTPATNDGRTFNAGDSLNEGAHYSHDGAGNYSFAPDFRGHDNSLKIQYIVSDPTATPSALPALGLELAMGYDGQPAWGYLVSQHPDQAIGYSGLAYLRAAAYALSTNAEVGNHNFELSTFSEYSSTIVDAAPARILQEFLTDGRTGALWPAAKLGDLTAYNAATIAQGLFLSPGLDTQQAATEWVTYLLKLTNADCVWSEGQLKIVPLLDQPANANGVAFAPNTTPVYDLGEDHYIATGADSPLAPTIKAADDLFNNVRIELLNRANAYNTDIAEWKDDADINDRGLRTMDVIEAHAICTMPIASYVATLIGVRQLTVRRTFKFKLPWTFSLLEPLDLVTLTEPQLGLLRLPVRINSISEADDYTLDFEVEEAPIGMASAPRYGAQQTGGFEHDYNADPGVVATPFFFEPPIELTATGLEVWTAVTGNTPAWGGALVWASFDNITYDQVGRVEGGARYGDLTAAIGVAPTDTVNVQLAGQGGLMLSGSATDAAADKTLLFVGDASGGEFLDYQEAVLTAANRYSLSPLLRGRYGSNVAARASGKVVRVDQAIAKSEPLDLAMVGQTIFFKFTSFNIYGGGGEDLADVQAYSYTITGAMLKLPPTDVAALYARFEGFGIRLYWPAIPDQDILDYELRVDGASWETAAPLARVGGTNYLWQVQAAANARKIWIKAHDRYGNESRHATELDLVVPLPNATNLMAMISGPNIQLNWLSVVGAFAIDHYLVSRGPSAAAQTVIAESLTTRFELRADYLGTQVFGVAAVDVAGNVGPFVFTQVDIVAPGAPPAGNANHPAQEVIDNNVLLYWTPPTTGTLPIASYDVRRGTTYAGGTAVGNNGNATFTAIFEQTSGTFTYWVAAIDTAGNVGAATPITAVVNQPPDFLLRSSIDSVFDGTLSGLYLDGARMYGPSFGETFGAHFTDRSWATPQDQIAAGSPYYFEPSATTASYEELFDYGTVLNGTTITATMTSNQLFGATTITAQISYKAAVGDAWTDAPAGLGAVYASGFRYVKIRFEFAAAGGDDLLEVVSLNVRLSVKLLTDSGKGYANAGDSGGTPVTFNLAFVDAETPRIQPNGTTALIGICNFVDAPYPTTFMVFIFDVAGNRVSAPFSWDTRGFLGT